MDFDPLPLYRPSNHCLRLAPKIACVAAGTAFAVVPRSLLESLKVGSNRSSAVADDGLDQCHVRRRFPSASGSVNEKVAPTPC